MFIRVFGQKDEVTAISEVDHFISIFGLNKKFPKPVQTIKAQLEDQFRLVLRAA